MSYKIEMSESGKFYHVLIEREVSVELARKFTAKIREKSLETGIRRFLFDVRNARNISSVSDNYFFAYEDSSELDLDRTARVAILTEPEDDSHDFAVVALKNAGHLAKLFRDESSSIEWMEDDSIRPPGQHSKHTTPQPGQSKPK
ncbi:hypothetical protein ACFL2O_05360 [Thermodesulfobacteriota bacterium]